MANNNQPLVPPPINWDALNMDNPSDALNDNRPGRLNVYMPPYDAMPPNVILRDSAIMFFVGGPAFADDDLVQEIRSRLAQILGGGIARFQLTPTHPSRNRFLLRCASEGLRNAVCQMEYLNVRDRALQFVRWRHGVDSQVERSTFYTRIRIRNVPLNLWNGTAIRILTSGFGTPARIAPHFGPGHLEELVILVLGGHPVNIPHEIIVGQEPYATPAQVIIDGYMQISEFMIAANGPALEWQEPIPVQTSSGSNVSD